MTAAQAAVDPTIEGEKAIAEYIHRSVRTVRRLSRRSFDPLPVFRYCGKVEAKQSALDAWKARQRRHVSDPVPSSPVVSRATRIVRRTPRR